MTTSTPWFRLCLDLSHDGDWIGSSIDVYDGIRHVGIHVMSEPSPFSDSADLLEELVEWVETRYGVQLRLFR